MEVLWLLWYLQWWQKMCKVDTNYLGYKDGKLAGGEISGHPSLPYQSVSFFPFTLRCPVTMCYVLTSLAEVSLPG